MVEITPVPNLVPEDDPPPRMFPIIPPRLSLPVLLVEVVDFDPSDPVSLELDEPLVPEDDPEPLVLLFPVLEAAPPLLDVPLPLDDLDP
jgi:hypothetical protein